ncbi:MAG TPA: MerR family transcriptional regulator [Rubrivivax sp.]|nr:MerR family transcriptional regulator [Rubrivivax sp.]
MEKTLPSIPAKRYFTIGEVSELCGVKPYVLRYWEQEFTQLKPMKRRGNRRYYQHHEVLLVRRICDLLYDQGFTISGARNRLSELGLTRGAPPAQPLAEVLPEDEVEVTDDAAPPVALAPAVPTPADLREWSVQQLRQELLSIRELLGT